jgi:cytochrome c556
MRLLKQSTAASVMVLMVDSTDHVTGKTGLTLTITASKNGAAFGSISPTVNERGSGWYELQLTTAHTDTLGDLALHVTGTAADPTDTLSYIVPRHLADLAYPATSGRSLAVESDGMVYTDAREWLGVAPLALSSQMVQALAADIAAGAITSSEAPALANLDVAVSTRALESGGNVATIMGKTNNLPSDPADESLLEAAIAGVQSDTNDIQTRLPAALVSGRMDANLSAWKDVVPLNLDTQRVVVDVDHIRDDKINSDVFDDAAITAAAIAPGAIGSSEAPLLANLDVAVSTRGTANAGDSMALTSGAVDAVLDEVVEGSLTFRQMLRLFMSALANKSSGGGTTTIAFRDVADSKARITATVDTSGNRTAISVDGS